MTWLETATTLKNANLAFVLITLTHVRGHAPRGAGSKMIVTQEDTFGSIGGGNLEQTAIKKARALLLNKSGNKSSKAALPEQFTLKLNPKNGDHGIQCCGGEVTILLEPFISTKPSVAIFGAGHVGWALTHILSLFPINIYLIDSRKEQLEPAQSITLQATATITLNHIPIPETMIDSLPKDSHILVMTHDHAEDLAIVDKALQRDPKSFLGLIGSSSKWAHFQKQLKSQGHSDEALEHITTPIGLTHVKGKSPQAIAVAISAQLLSYLDFEEGDF